MSEEKFSAFTVNLNGIFDNYITFQIRPWDSLANECPLVCRHFHRASNMTLQIHKFRNGETTFLTANFWRNNYCIHFYSLIFPIFSFAACCHLLFWSENSALPKMPDFGKYQEFFFYFGMCAGWEKWNVSMWGWCLVFTPFWSVSPLVIFVFLLFFTTISL